MHLCWTVMVVTCLSVVETVTGGDVFTSVQEMERLYHLEDRLLQTLDTAIRFHQTKVHILTQRYTQLVSERPLPQLGHPIDSFVLIRRLAKDWPLILNLAAESFIIPEDLVKEIQSIGEQEMSSAVRGLTRLQFVYSLDTELLADGMVGEVMANSVLTAADCMEIVEWLLPRHEFLLTSSWLRTALRRVVQEGDETVVREKIYSYIHVVTKLAGCDNPDVTKSSHPLLLQLLTHYPSFNLDVATAKLYHLALSHDCSWYNKTRKKDEVDMIEEEHEMYNWLCSGEEKRPGGLRCHLVHYHNPALRLAPFKLEEIHTSPPVVLIHQVISDSEINELKESFPKVMSDCQVLQNNGESVKSTYRMCMRGWLGADTTPVSARISRRIGQMANLRMDSSEDNQIGCYGLGGEYKLHYDHIKGNYLDDTEDGHRLATVMLYLNDVTLGGYTVFPYLRVAIAPVKGAAIMWFNTLYDSELDRRMLHGGCPVLLGSKWVLNKWIHEAGQDFVTQCPTDKKYPKDFFYL